MNDAKWRELRLAMIERHEKPRYRVQCLLSPATDPDNWEGDWYYHLPTFAWIEWLDLDPIHVKSRGHLLEAPRVDLTEEILRLLRSLSIPCEMRDGLIRIYGYRRQMCPLQPVPLAAGGAGASGHSVHIVEESGRR